MTLTPAQRTLRARIAAHAQWAATPDRSERTQRARDRFDARFEREVDEEFAGQELTDRQRAELVASRRSQYFASLALRSSQARAARRAS